MSFSVSLSSIDKGKVYNAVGEAVVKQGVSFVRAGLVASAVAEFAYNAPGEIASVSVSGHHDEKTEGGYASVSVSYKQPEVKVEAALVETTTGPVASVGIIPDLQQA